MVDHQHSGDGESPNRGHGHVYGALGRAVLSSERGDLGHQGVFGRACRHSGDAGGAGCGYR